MSKKSLIILVSIVVFLLFYWYQIRPSIIRHECNKIAIQKSTSVLLMSPSGTTESFHSSYDYFYKMCLRDKGL